MATAEISQQIMEEMAESKRLQAQRTQAGIPALKRLVSHAQGGAGQAHYLRRFLLALYNASEWPFDMTSLRALDRPLQADALAVIELDWCGREVHTYLDDGEAVFQAFWERES